MFYAAGKIVVVCENYVAVKSNKIMLHLLNTQLN